MNNRGRIEQHCTDVLQVTHDLRSATDGAFKTKTHKTCTYIRTCSNQGSTDTINQIAQTAYTNRLNSKEKKYSAQQHFIYANPKRVTVHVRHYLNDHALFVNHVVRVSWKDTPFYKQHVQDSIYEAFTAISNIISTDNIP